MAISNELAVQQEEYNLFAMLKPRILQRRGLWYVEHGVIRGCGKTPYRAINDFNAAFHDKKGTGVNFNELHQTEKSGQQLTKI